MRLLAYADQISVAPGDTIHFMVSCNPPGHYHAEAIHLICGDTNPGGPGFRAEHIASLGSHAGGPQPIYAGSYIRVPDHPAFHGLESFTVAVLVWPTLPGDGEQTLVARHHADRGFALVLDAEGRPALRIDGTLLPGGPSLVRRRWYLVAATVGNDEVHVLCKTLVSGELRTTRHAHPPPASIESPLTVAARDGSTHYNGKLEAPTLWRGALTPEALLARIASPEGNDLVCRLDFSRGIDDTAVYDVSPNGLIGETVNLPMRAVTGHLWTGEELCWHRNPEHYAAIHFHDDDLYDAGWKVSFAWIVPEHVRSGVYAVRLATEDAEAFVPFAVRGRQPAENPIALLLPTASYLAYANDHCHLEGANPQLLGHRLIELQPADIYLAEHPELGCSLYDRHRDGSGSAYSSRLRPIPNMSPKHVWWLGGPGSGVWQLSADLHITDWLEATGQDYEVITDEDLHREGVESLRPYRVALTGTHPEYTSTRMWDALHAYIEGGGRLMYLGGNGFYWRIAFHERLPGVIEVRRAEDGTRSWASEPGEYFNAFDGAYGGLWRRNGRPPQTLVGVGFTAQGFGRSGHYIRTEQSRDQRAAFIFEGVESDRIGDAGLVGHGAAGLELDRADHDLGTPADALVVLTSTCHEDHVILANEEILVNLPNVTGDQSPLIRSDVVFFANAAGGAVFSVGSIAWSGSLAVNGYEGDVARITANVLARFLDSASFDWS